MTNEGNRPVARAKSEVFWVGSHSKYEFSGTDVMTDNPDECSPMTQPNPGGMKGRASSGNPDDASTAA